MKNYTITVNGNVYDVTVEEGVATGTASAPVTKTVAPKAAAPKAVASGTQGSVKINAPMQGKIVSVKAAAGQAVKKGDVILVLEAMKMENEIVSPQDGTVASIEVSAGDKVDAGAVVATLN